MPHQSTRNNIGSTVWFPHRVNFTEQSVELIRISRQQIAEATFLAGEAFKTDNLERKSISFNDVEQPVSRAPVFIFHSAFCCSTLLARVLDFPGKVCALKEPQITLDLADYIRKTGNIPANTEAIKQLLTIPFNAAERTIVKPTNLANNLLLAELPLLSDCRIILLYGSLRDFLISVLKKGEQGRFMIRRMYIILAQDPTRFKNISAHQLATLTDLQIAAMTWLLQTELFENCLQSYPDYRIASLHCNEFLEQPEKCITAIDKYFELNFTPHEITTISNSEALNFNAKNQQARYDSIERTSESKKIETEFGSTLDHICQWADGLSLTGRIKHRLSRPLLL